MLKALRNLVATSDRADSEGKEMLGTGQRVPGYAGRARILIVEEDHAMALSMAYLLENAGYDIMGTVRSVAEMAVKMAILPADLAIVDQSGDGSVAFPAVAFLQRSNVPFVFVGSQCTARAIPASLADIPRLGSFPWASELLGVVASVLGRNGNTPGAMVH